MTRILHENRPVATNDDHDGNADPVAGGATAPESPRQEASRGRVGRPDPYAQYYLGLSRQLATLTDMGGVDSTVAVGMTSAVRGEGVTSVTLNVASAASRDLGGRVLLIDGNLQNPKAAEVAGARHGQGLADILMGEASLADCIQSSTLSAMDVLAAGTTMACEQFSSNTDRVRNLLRDASRAYRMILIDLPPATELTACLPLACCLDGVVMVVEAERTRDKVAIRAQQQLKQSGANVLGVVLNQRREYVPNWIYKRV